jgi:outer membrane receptor for ferrienterochelin and colicins
LQPELTQLILLIQLIIMKSFKIILAILLLSVSQFNYAQREKTDANVFGHVVCTDCDEHLSFATIQIKGTTIGTTTDGTGHYQLINLPEGKHILSATFMGYKPKEIEITIKKGETQEVNFELEEDALGLSEVVVSADRGKQKRTEAPVMVNTITPKLFNTTQSVTLGEGLNFSPGLRLENNCQNCGFTQVRMNGMEGPYSQILINSRPIFSGLAGVYGLELIPSNMIEKVEVVRGGGSALYGSNAIAGTINIILKDPKINSYEAGAGYALTGIGVKGSGGEAADYSVNFNTSLVSDDHKTGMSLYGFTRKRAMFDANNDGFSEIAPIENLTFGARAFHRFGFRDKLTFDFFGINEERDGGNMQEYPLHERDIAEAVSHKMKVAGLTYERYFREYDLLTAYASGQFLNRDSYYGAGQSLSDYGNTKDNSYNIGVQYKGIFGNSTVTGGIENTGSFLLDKKLGYPDLENAVIDFSDSTIYYTHAGNTVVADQSSITTGLFAQYEVRLNRLKVIAGARFDRYEIKDLALEGHEPKTGEVISPRISFMYDLLKEVQARVSYSQGYRAPQIFDEDLHIETSGSRQVIHQNAPDLQQETSHSIMASLDFNRLIGTVYTGFLVEGFYTKLVDAFANEFGEPDENGTVIYTRVNSDGGAVVQGINMELKIKPLGDFSLTSGFTLQTSKFEEPQEDFDEKRFFRTPNQYGFFAIDWNVDKNLRLSATGNFTGSMLLPYFGTDNPDGELRESDNFFDLVELNPAFAG